MAESSIKTATKALVRRTGFEVQRQDPGGSYPKRRQALIEGKGVNTVLDVGAHAGEFGESLRHHGYRGPIVSYEPVAAQFERLHRVADIDPAWNCRKVAVGDRVGEVEIHISGNDGFSSSIREMDARHEEADPASSYVGSETVAISTLDSEQASDSDSAPFFLKVDTQGFESEVLAGGSDTLGRCAMVELELGLVELYSGQALFDELVALMGSKGFVLNDVEPGFRDERSGQLLQVDALFVATASPAA